MGLSKLGINVESNFSIYLSLPPPSQQCSVPFKSRSRTFFLPLFTLPSPRPPSSRGHHIHKGKKSNSTHKTRKRSNKRHWQIGKWWEAFFFASRAYTPKPVKGERLRVKRRMREVEEEGGGQSITQPTSIALYGCSITINFLCEINWKWLIWWDRLPRWQNK